MCIRNKSQLTSEVHRVVSGNTFQMHKVVSGRQHHEIDCQCHFAFDIYELNCFVLSIHQVEQREEFKSTRLEIINPKLRDFSDKKLDRLNDKTLINRLDLQPELQYTDSIQPDQNSRKHFSFQPISTAQITTYFSRHNPIAHSFDLRVEFQHITVGLYFFFQILELNLQ